MIRRAAPYLALVGMIAFLAPAAQAGVTVKGVDTSSYPQIRVSVVTSKRTPNAPSLAENGHGVSLAGAQNLGSAKSVVLAIDRSQSMKGGPLANAIAAARAFIASKPGADRVAVATFATEPLFLTEFSTTARDAAGVLGSIKVDPQQGTTLYDGLVNAASKLEAEPLPARVIIVVTDGNETRSRSSLHEAVAAANRAGAAVYVVAIESPKFNPAPLKQLAAETGGAYRSTSSSATLSAEYASIAAELRRTWRLDYLTSVRPGDRATVQALSEGSASKVTIVELPASLGDGSGESKPSRLLPAVFYKTVLGTQVMALLSFFIVLLAATLALTTVKGSRLRKRIAPHLGPTTDMQKRKKEQKERFAAAAGLFNATEGALSHWKFWTRLERLLERSDLPLRTVELVYLIAGLGLLGATFSTLTGQSGVITLALLVGFGSAPVGVVWFKATRRLKAFEDQLPDVLITLAAALKAGHSFKQGLQTIVDEGNPPASKELHRVLSEARLGRPLELALADMAVRLGSKNFDFVITAVKIQQQVGGSLAGLVDMVADTVRQRLQFIRKVQGLTAMGRAGAYVLVALPFFIGAAITFINPTYMDPLYHSHVGHMLIYSGLAMMAFGSLILKKIVSFKG